MRCDAISGGDRDPQRQRARAAAAAEAVRLRGEESAGRIPAAVGRHAAFLGLGLGLGDHLLRLFAAVVGGPLHRVLLRRGHMHRSVPVS